MKVVSLPRHAALASESVFEGSFGSDKPYDEAGCSTTSHLHIFNKPLQEGHKMFRLSYIAGDRFFKHVIG
jgi:hypothetical protein